MSKDPAFLFYSSDFLTGVSDLTMEERGQYITLLCLQHQKGHLSAKTIRLALGYDLVNSKSDLLGKFVIDQDGYYYNERLEAETDKRAKVAETHRAVGKLGGRPAEQAHHVFGGPNRKHSDKYCLISPLCAECHRRVHADYDLSCTLKRKYQQIFEAKYGHTMYMAVFGRNFL